MKFVLCLIAFGAFASAADALSCVQCSDKIFGPESPFCLKSDALDKSTPCTDKGISCNKVEWKNTNGEILFVSKGCTLKAPIGSFIGCNDVTPDMEAAISKSRYAQATKFCSSFCESDGCNAGSASFSLQVPILLSVALVVLKWV